jgi:2',3'-cyclic-nucleotide 2'-phosphodiesterase (5'-nucleotidase family)
METLVLAANANTSKEPSMKSDNLKKSVVFEKNGVKVGVIGYLTPKTRTLNRPNEVEYIDEIEAIK